MDKKSIYLAFFLAIIGMVSAGLIASVNSATQPIIQKRIQLEKEETIREFFPTNTSFDETKVADANYKAVKVSYKVMGAENELLGYIYEVSTNGYGGAITALISYDINTDQLTNLKYIGAFSETPGFGTRVKEPEFMTQLINKQVEGTEIDTLSGATITSSAVKTAIETANAYYLSQK
ncbi:MAG: FMN-binding protein [Turicibacter sp.]